MIPACEICPKATVFRSVGNLFCAIRIICPPIYRVEAKSIANIIKIEISTIAPGAAGYVIVQKSRRLGLLSKAKCGRQHLITQNLRHTQNENIRELEPSQLLRLLRIVSLRDVRRMEFGSPDCTYLRNRIGNIIAVKASTNTHTQLAFCDPHSIIYL